ncbi:MAG: type II secretion system protein [Bacilli bacterium]|nr:type II secretion system protein [Bacilli bacterium]
MKRLNKNNKGFTLIELLAVIVILGVLMIIAVPMVTQYITSAKKGAFVSTAKAYVSSARYAYLNGDYTCGTNIDTGQGGSIAIKFTDIPVDKTGGKSSFSQDIKLDLSYVIIEADQNGRYRYYVRMVDAGGNGWDTAVNEDTLKKQHVKNNAKLDSITTIKFNGVNPASPETAQNDKTATICSKAATIK